MRATILLLSPVLAGPLAAQAELVHLANEGFLLRSEGRAVLIDAFLEEPYAGYASLEREALERLRAARPPFDRVDLALVSHVHRDHFQPELAAEFLAASPDTVLATTAQVLERLGGEGRVLAAGEDGAPLRATLGGVEVECFRLSHGSGRHAGIENLGHLLEVGGVRFLHLGDAVPDPEAFARLELAGRVDVALVPYWYLDGGAGQRLIDEHVAPRHVVAMHVPPPEMADLRRKLADTDVLVMDRGERRAFRPAPGLEVHQDVVPVLVNRPANPAARLTMRGPLTLDGLVVEAGAPVTRLALARADEDGGVDVERPGPWLALEGELHDAPETSTLRCRPLELGPGRHVLWLLAGIEAEAPLAETFPLEVRALLAGGERLEPRDARHAPDGLRPGVRVRHRGDDGSEAYRIPCLVRAEDGALLAAYDVRRDGMRDLQGDIDIGLSRSTDGGRTWEPMRIVLDMGTRGGLPERYDGVSDACLLVDRETGRVFVFACWMHGLRDEEGEFREDLDEDATAWAHQWHRGSRGSGPGLSPRETAQIVVATSDDDGRTWSAPRNLTAEVKDPGWYLAAPSPGRGITLDDGTLVVPAGGRDADQVTFSSLLISRDRGETWRFAETPAARNTTEAAVAQISDGRVMLNMRDNRNRGDVSDSNGRRVAVTADLGRTWSRHPSSRRAHLLPEPVCMASLIALADGTLVFSNPADRRRRRNLTVKASHDDGLSWPEEHRVVLDEVFGAYSCLAPIDEDAVGCLYESSRGHLVFQAVAREELE